MSPDFAKGLELEAYSDVFARKEAKYLLDARQHGAVLAAVRERMAPTEFGHSHVQSIYFDDPQRSLIERSLDKPLYKEKLRLRIYGDPSPATQAFVEIKKKFEGVVYKRRVSCTLAAAEAFLKGEPYDEACRRLPLADPEAARQSLGARSLQIAREIAFFMERHAPLSPFMLVECDRLAFADPCEGGTCKGGLRVTFDMNLTATRQPKGFRRALESDRMGPRAATSGPLETPEPPETAEAEPSRTKPTPQTSGPFPIIARDKAVMEAKNAGPLPFWLIDALDGAKAYKQSFSKCGAAYMNLQKGA